MLEKLKSDVCRANIELQNRQLVIYSWGNVSGIDRAAGIVAIKPSGVSYDRLTAEMMVLLDMEGNVVEGDLTPSSDTPTHLELYRKFSDIGGICHTHSENATVWAQARKPITVLGTTHCDYFYGNIPITRMLRPEEIKTDYELNTGRVIVEAFSNGGIVPSQMPAVLVAGHGPFTWGRDAEQSVESAVVLEQVAKIAAKSIAVNPQLTALPKALVDKHYLRKHGKNAYYGQKKD